MPASAAGTINNNNFLDAAAHEGTTYNGVTYACMGLSCTYSLADGEYVLGSDIDISASDGLNIDGVVSIDFNGHKIISNVVNNGAGDNHTATLTLSGNGGIAGNLVANGILNINGGTFGAEDSNGVALNINDGAEVIINDGKFLSGDAASVMVMSFTDGLDLTINGGEFKSANHYGIEVMLESANANMKISGGTFTGATAGMQIDWNNSSIELSGGTFTATNADGNAIIYDVATGTNSEAALKGLLVDGYEYSNATFASGDDYGMVSARIAAANTTVRSINTVTEEPAVEEEQTTPTTTPTGSKEDAMEEMSREMEKVIAKGTSNGSTKKASKKVKAPDTGMTEGAVATSGATVLTMATLLGAGVVLKKKYNA
ncbi:hypothetical protein IJ114_00180 [Candidatus Saccharibacteria bacterium]|nr:hypothetical protein [Candidatus Saccharibacteria bacterium]